ncbi:MAG TPA: hypothetical protein VGA30_07495, partial [Actinomycetota bacterium]
MTARGLTVRTVNLRLGSVRFSRAKFLSGHPGTITAATADGAIIITRAVASASGRNTRPVTVRFARGQVLLSGAGWEAQLLLVPRCLAAPSGCARS